MLFRYLRSNFLFWFGCIFAVVGLIVFVVTVFVPFTPTAGTSTFWVTVALVFMGSCFFIPGAILAGKQLRRILRSVTALERGQYVVGRVEGIVSANENVNGMPLYCVAWSWKGHDGKRRKANSLALSKSDAEHWKKGDEIAAYVHPSDLEFAEADVYRYRAE
jgi:uncharacterized membrane protein YhaH (DUF805 family)